MIQPKTRGPDGATLLFVDDEARVLTSMRAMFRREYHVLTANSGAEALTLLADNHVDVVISDQRMPSMTGVELLTQVKSRAPDVVRILLTGYADLKAIEDSLNEAEVYRYLMKPCPPDQLRDAIGSALAAEELVVQEPVRSNVVQLQVPERKAPRPAARTIPADTQVADAQSAGVVGDTIILSDDSDLCETVTRAAKDKHLLGRVHTVTSLKAAIDCAKAHSISILVTDQASDVESVAAIREAMEAQAPGLVTILASARSDAHALIGLINSGEVFRFLLKPVQAGQCGLWLQSAQRRYAAIPAAVLQQAREIARAQAAGENEGTDVETGAVPATKSGANWRDLLMGWLRRGHKQAKTSASARDAGR